MRAGRETKEWAIVGMIYGHLGGLGVKRRLSIKATPILTARRSVHGGFKGWLRRPLP